MKGKERPVDKSEVTLYYVFERLKEKARYIFQAGYELGMISMGKQLLVTTWQKSSKPDKNAAS